MNERLVRWQGYSMGQFTFVLNMFFGLSVSTLAFGFSLLQDEKFILISFPKFIFKTGLILPVFSKRKYCSGLEWQVLYRVT